MYIKNRQDNEVHKIQSAQNSTEKTHSTREFTGKFKSYIKVNGEMVNLCRFTILEDAINSRKEAELKYKFHENHGIEKI